MSSCASSDWRRTEANLISVPQVDFFDIQEIVLDFALAHSCHVKYTQVSSLNTEISKDVN